MVSDSDLLDQQGRGQVALQLLENELLKEALDAIDREVMEQWVGCPARDKEGKEALWQLIKTSRKFREVLTGYIDTGKLAAHKLKQYEERGKLASIFRK